MGGNYSGNEIVNGIRNRDSKVINYIYKEYFKLVIKQIKELGGTADDAKDIFQIVMINIYNRTKKKKLEVANFKQYILNACRFEFYESYKANSNQFVEIREVEELIDFKDDDHIRLSLFYKSFDQLKEECKKLLELRIEKVSYERIQEMMGIAVQSLKNKRKRCLEYLFRLYQTIKKEYDK